MLQAFLGSDDVNTIREVRDPLLASRLEGLWTDYDRDSRQARRDIGAFSRDWRDTYAATLPQEQAAVGGYYDGSIERALAGLRARRSAAVTAAGDRALQEVARGGKLGILGGGQGTGSSYLQRLGLSNASDILIRNALDASNAERGDFDAIERARINLLGRRLDLQKNQLMPYNVRTADLARRLGNAGSLGQLGSAAYFTGLENDKNFFDRMGDSSAAIWNMAGSVYGGGAGNVGGGPSTQVPQVSGGYQPPPQAYNPNYAANPAYGSWTSGYGGMPYTSVATPGGGGMSIPSTPAVYNWGT